MTASLYAQTYTEIMSLDETWHLTYCHPGCFMAEDQACNKINCTQLTCVQRISLCTFIVCAVGLP